MSTREIHSYELGNEASLDFASNWEDSGAELAIPQSQTPVTQANQQQHIQTNQPAVQLQQQTTIATARSIPQVNYPPQGYAMPPYSDQFQQFYPFHYGLPPYGVMTSPRLHNYILLWGRSHLSPKWTPINWVQERLPVDHQISSRRWKTSETNCMTLAAWTSWRWSVMEMEEVSYSGIEASKYSTL